VRKKMSEFVFTAFIGATRSVTIEAESLEEAIARYDGGEDDELNDALDTPTICHQCAGQVDIGDVYKLEVYDVAADKEVKVWGWGS
jgi:hypothetical protein